MQRVSLNNTDARGRNGWFAAREAMVKELEGKVCVDVVSRRPTLPGPVRLELGHEDAAALARSLLRVAVDRGGLSKDEGI